MENASTPAATPAAPSSTPSATPAAPPASSAPASTATPATATPATGGDTQPKAPEPRRYRFKANGEDREIEAAHVEALSKALGLEPDEILKGAGMAQSSYQRWQEAAKLRREVEEREAAAKKRFEDPRITEIKAKDPSLSDEDAWALLRVQEMYDRSQMSPEQKALAEERTKREALERQMKDREEKERHAQTQAETKVEADKIDRQLTEAMQKHALPKNPAWARAVLDHMAAAVRAGEAPDVEASTLYVKRLVQRDDQTRLASMSDETLEGWLGKAIIDRILKRSIAKVQGGPPSPVPQVNGEAQAPKAPTKFVTDVEEWRKQYR